MTPERDLCDACGTLIRGIKIGRGRIIVCRNCDKEIRQITKEREKKKLPINQSHIAKQMYLLKNICKDHLIRDIPESLWKMIKKKSLQESCPLRNIFIKALYNYCGKSKE